MLTFTNEAAAKVQALKAEIADESRMLRVFVKAGGCSGMEYGMSFEEAREGDQILESNSVRYLIDEKSLELLSGSEVHFDDGLNGKGFEVRNPNAKSTCGCGRSFQ